MQPDALGPGAAPSPAPRHTAVVIPVRGLEGAKSRLGEVLDAEERRELVELLLHRTIAVARATPGVDLVAVVSPDPATLGAARSAGALAIEQRTAGLNHSIVEARASLRGRADRLVVLPGDLPGVAADDIAALLAAADELRGDGGRSERGRGTEAGPTEPRGVVILAPDRHGRGTNALVLDPADVIDPAFGIESRAAHATRAAEAGAAYREVPGRLAIDVDTPDDLLLVESLHPEALHAH